MADSEDLGWEAGVVLEVRVVSDEEEACGSDSFDLSGLRVGTCPPVPYLDCKVARAAE